MARHALLACRSHVDARVALEGLGVVDAQERAAAASGAELERARQRVRWLRAEQRAQVGALFDEIRKKYNSIEINKYINKNNK